MFRLVAEVTGNLDAIKTVGRGLVIGLAAMARQPEYAGQVRATMFIGIGLIEALALFGIAFSFII
jgi:F-type H+-transporting ATPase subunit c